MMMFVLNSKLGWLLSLGLCLVIPIYRSSSSCASLCSLPSLSSSSSSTLSSSSSLMSLPLFLVDCLLVLVLVLVCLCLCFLGFCLHSRLPWYLRRYRVESRSFILEIDWLVVVNSVVRLVQLVDCLSFFSSVEWCGGTFGETSFGMRMSVEWPKSAQTKRATNILPLGGWFGYFKQLQMWTLLLLTIAKFSKN